MKQALRRRGADLRGVLSLAADATLGITDVVESMHQRIASPPLPGSSAADGRTSGLTGLVYKSIRSLTRSIGAGADALLQLLPPAAQEGEPNRRREAFIGALNGVFGDHLAASGNPLATAMCLCSGGRPLLLERAALAAALPDATQKLLVLVHGLCMNDLQWLRDGHDHGAALARDLGFTPIYLRYNSGLHVAANGRELALQLEALLDQWPQRLRRFAMLGHSMGGLLARSALHHGERLGHRWPALLDDLLFLGTPHLGAPLERAGHGLDVLLSAAPYAAPLARLGKARSAGITDLRHGRVVDKHHKPPTLPAHARCFAIAGSLGPSGSGVKSRLLGDGLVPLKSALGHDSNPRRALAFAAERQWIAHDTHHLQLLSSAEVYAHLRQCLL